jgi:hypothetical protein
VKPRVPSLPLRSTAFLTSDWATRILGTLSSPRFGGAHFGTHCLENAAAMTGRSDFVNVFHLSEVLAKPSEDRC